MREIKFKAWDKERKIMLEPKKLCHLEGELSKNIYPFLIPLQYTGLKDKNGKEIYEGDILIGLQKEQKEDDAKGFKIKGIVYSERGGFSLFNKAMNKFSTEQDCQTIKNYMWCDQGRFNIPDCYMEIKNMEIIGNIYENSDLMNIQL